MEEKYNSLTNQNVEEINIAGKTNNQKKGIKNYDKFKNCTAKIFI